MPYNRKNRYRRNYARKSRGKRAVKKTLTRMRNLGMGFFKLRTAPGLNSDVGGDIAYGIATTDPALTTSVNGAAYVNAVEDWTNLLTLYDQYRVFAVKIQYIPDIPNDETPVVSYKPMYVYVDYDNTAPVTTIGTAIQYENCKIVNMYRPWTRYVKVPKSLNPTTTGNIVEFGWMDIAAPQPCGHIGIMTENASASTLWGTLLVTYYVAFKNRR